MKKLNFNQLNKKYLTANKLYETINFQPVFKNTLFDNGDDCKWAIFFEAMSYSWGYKTPTDYEDILQPTFRIWGKDIHESFYTYSVNRQITSVELEKLQNWSSSTNEDLILLDGPPAPGAYTYFNAKAGDGLSTEQIQELMKYPRERFGGILQGPEEAIWYEQAEDYFDTNCLYEKPMVTKIINAVNIASSVFLSASKRHTAEAIQNRYGYPRAATASDLELSTQLLRNLET